MQAIAALLQAADAAPTALMQADILAHLQRILNSRRGQSLSAPHYGIALGAAALRDVLALLPQSTARLERVVVAAAQAHEPRLERIRLREPSRVQAHALSMFLTAHSVTDGTDMNIDIHIMPSGRVQVRRP